MAEADPKLREKQPWQAAYDRDYAWLGQVMVEHYAGDDTNVRTLLGGVIAAHAGISVDEFEEQADSFLHSAQHPTLGRSYLECAYAPMVELLRLLDAQRASRTTSRRAAAATSCGRSARSCTGSRATG